MLALAKVSVSATQSIEQSLKSGNRDNPITIIKHRGPVREGKRRAKVARARFLTTPAAGKRPAKLRVSLMPPYVAFLRLLSRS